ncbi:PfkB family carbohydrate kinase [Actinomadura sp. 6N118]|uniref:PfkB family carbohydrate kinase n=1 Tax=Actinomadura sp. 6N118 TaxID=3375151 RepID=UPI0037B9AD1D
MVVVGQIARDLVLVVDEVPGPGGTAGVRRRRELLGGKGANQAVALAQLGMSVGLVGVVGEDEVGERLLDQIRRDGIDDSLVVRRSGEVTGLIVDVVEGTGRWRYLEDLPGPMLLSEADVAAAADRLRAAQWVSVQLQQPSAAVRAAVTLARDAGVRVALDGVPEEEHREELLAAADVVRADAKEAELLVGARLEGVEAAVRAGRELLRCGPSLVALAVESGGNVFVWTGGHLALPLIETPVKDTTGAGDAFTAALVAGLARGFSPEQTAFLAVAAAATTVGHPGGRPELTSQGLHDMLERVESPPDAEVPHAKSAQWT